MASLQIRDLPEGLHRQLQLRARLHHRSLAQQALCDLEAVAGGDPRARRQQVLQRLRDYWEHSSPVHWPESPEDMLHADRER